MQWPKGLPRAFPNKYWRALPPCAPRAGARAPGPATPTPLPMFGSKPLKPDRAELVGRYALQIYWSDGHSSGISTFDYLRGLCPCADCESARENVQ